jgi:uncharacterized membrane protein
VGLGVTSIVLQLVIAAWGLSQVGPGATVPIHWGVDGMPNGYAPAVVGFLVAPVISVVMLLVLVVVPRVEPRRENLLRSGDAYRTISTAVLALFALIQVAVVTAGTGRDVLVVPLIGIGVGLVFAVLGNVLATVRSNYLVGVRTPWTLSSDRSWDRTHRVAGRLFVVTGIATACAALAGQTWLLLAALLGGSGATVAASVIVSYREWKADPDRRPVGGGS